MTSLTRFLPAWVFFAIIAASPCVALDLELPDRAQLTAERLSEIDSFFAPVAPFDGQGVPAVEIEGPISRQAWRISVPGLTSLQIMQPLREQLATQGYELIFECDALTCGGFDFRFDTEVLPGPNMYVNISRFRYLTALRGPLDEPEQAVGVLVSASAESAYVQVITADKFENEVVLQAPEQPKPQEPAPSIEEPYDMESALISQGHIILEDLVFATGTSDLESSPSETLAQLAEILESRIDFRVALVGHTDTVGGLQANIAISRARARSVRNRLVSEYGLDAGRLDAEGMGYLAPIATNLTDEGRARNRRVEAVLLNIE